MKLLPFTTFLIGVIPVLGGGFQFPSAGSSVSPDGKWKLMCKSPNGAQADHLLLLKRIHGSTVTIRSFGRNCDVLWSVDSSRFAVTDCWASDRSDVLIYAVANPESNFSVAKKFPQHLMPEEELNGHCYFEARKWLNRHRLLVKISGHTDEPPVRGFEHEFIFDCLSGQFEEPVSNHTQQAAFEK